MTTFLLVRHGETDAIDRLMAGCGPGWHLNARGQRQVARLAERLTHSRIQAVYTSPLERAMETAAPIAQCHGLVPQPNPALGEINVGQWEGLSFTDLHTREDWRRFNAFRSAVRAPGGELMIEAQVRMVREIDCLCAIHPNETVLIVSHADPLRALIGHYLGIPIDLLLRLEIGLASLSALRVLDWGASLLYLNRTEELSA